MKLKLRTRLIKSRLYFLTPFKVNLQNTNMSNQSGFVALMSTIVIGAVLLAMTIEAGKSGFYTSILVLGNEAKEQSRLLAFECGNRSFATIVSRGGSVENETLMNGIGSCRVHEVKMEYPNKGYLTIFVTSDVRDSITNLELVYKTGNIHLIETVLSPVVVRELPFQPILYSAKEISVMP